MQHDQDPTKHLSPLYIVKLLKSGDNDQRQLVKDVVEPMAALGYFYASENNTRRLFIPLLELASRYLGTDGVLASVYTDYLDADMDDAHKALTIYMTLEFELGRQLIANTYERTLHYLVENATQQQQCLETTNGADQVVLNLHYLIKTTMSLLTRSEATEPVLGQVLHGATTGEDHYVALLGDLTRLLLDVTTHPDLYGKDCCQVASMALGAVINLGKDDSFVRDWILGWFFLDSSTTASAHMATLFGMTSPLEAFAGNAGWQGKDAPMLFIIRGMISTVRKQVLFLPCDTDLAISALMER
jgi:hypothetical protein